MSLIPSLTDIPDRAPVEPGNYDLVVKKAKKGQNKDGDRDCLMLVCEVVDEPNADAIFHKLWFPKASEDQTKQQTMWRMVKEFIQAIGIDPDSGADPEDFEGIEFSANVDLEDDEYGRRNTIQRVT